MEREYVINSHTHSLATQGARLSDKESSIQQVIDDGVRLSFERIKWTALSNWPTPRPQKMARSHRARWLCWLKLIKIIFSMCVLFLYMVMYFAESGYVWVAHGRTSESRNHPEEKNRGEGWLVVLCSNKKDLISGTVVTYVLCVLSSLHSMWPQQHSSTPAVQYITYI